jgi:hypothetical protein
VGIPWGAAGVAKTDSGRTGINEAVGVGIVQERPQPTALFEMPANFRKFDPHWLIERIKQSDVWVEPPG